MSFNFFEAIFTKALLMIGMENALNLVELPPPGDENSQIAKTLAIVNFHRKYMQQVFREDRFLR